MQLAVLLHIYQPPGQDPRIIRKVHRESYDKIVRILEHNNSAKITLNIPGSLTKQLIALGQRSFIRRIAALAKAGQIEFTGSAMYHPILPLLPKREVVRQVHENERMNRKAFGKTFVPKGFFLPELAYSHGAAKIIQLLGYQWLILDEIAFAGKLPDHGIQFNAPYRIAGTKLKVFFRNRKMSDLFFAKEIKTKNDFFRAIEPSQTSQNIVTIACDGELFGHHHPRLDRVLAELFSDERLQPILYSSLQRTHRAPIRPKESSWSAKPSELRHGTPFALWKDPANPIHTVLWKITFSCLQAFQRAKRVTAAARAELDRALHSDQYWWASAMPWFHVDMIEQGMDMFLRSLRLLPASPSTIARVLALRKDATQQARSWLKSGYAQKRAARYLRAEPYTRMFGGKQMKSTKK